ncbi:MAG: acetate kinase [Rhizobiales bacterium]|nr:acetate kinase [Rhizobacter sp.]
MTVLALNSGSSSLKFGLYRVDAVQADCLLDGAAECASAEGQAEAMADVVARLVASGLPSPDAIGHRVVHGGPALKRHVLIDATVLQQLDAAATFAPLHGPAGLAVIRLAQQHFAGTPQVACLDTVFHADLPTISRTLPIAREVQVEGIRRYGFHGLSCESVVRQLGPDLPGRLVVAHLGGGASITAIRSGRSIDTSMGLTPTGGVTMATRSGDLDPGLLLYLMREKRLDAAALDELVNRRSGLLGVSGSSGDMRHLHAAAAAADANAALAIEMFCMSVRKQVAAMTAVLGGIDRLVFTGGIGENDAQVRDSVCAGLAWVDGMQVQVLPSQEQEQIARHGWAICAADAV